MSWDTWWQLPAESPDEDALRSGADNLVIAAAGLLAVEIVPDADEADDDTVTCFFRFDSAVGTVTELVHRLDPDFNYVSEDFAGDLDPPLDAGSYRVELILSPGDDGEPGQMRLGSSDADNRACWPVAWLLGALLGSRIGATHEDDVEQDPGVAMGWNSAAVLRPKS